MKYFFTFLLVSVTFSLTAQIETDLSFTFSYELNQTYQPLEDYINLTEDIGIWDDYDLEDIYVNLNKPFILPGFEDKPMDILFLEGNGVIYLVNSSSSDVRYWIDWGALALGRPNVSPLIDSNNLDPGHILFKETEESIAMEFNNVAFEEELFLGDGRLRSRINFQMEFFYETLCVEIRYGFSEISETLMEFMTDSILVGNVFSIEKELDTGFDEYEYFELYGLLSGDPNQPEFFLVTEDNYMDFDGFPTLRSIPDEGTVYRFCLDETTAVSTTEQLESLSVYPNPASDKIFIKMDNEFLQSGVLSVQIMNVSGQIIEEYSLADSESINITHLPNGLYFAQIISEKYSVVKRFIKK
ncbi:MAG: T9SS C-terminal target domain-containing protein [Saprospirales bacterium]|nr:MAG: T9SS C-terminal target domain-containing protein [Saprospirales bacterium]